MAKAKSNGNTENPPTPSSNGNGQDNGHGNANIITISNMYEDYFLDYASYVILERAVPAIADGLKPVQRRILHSMFEKEDGRYHKVANIIGNTMQYHPHGDAAIGDALVNLGQKDLLIDPQGNWGDHRTGDSAAAARYIEARLTKFALTVAFNPQTTEWQLSYDGRKKEPVDLPMKFPLVLAQGADGIAVGLSTKILPHNFIELCKASIKILQDKRVKIYPDFMTGGSIDVSDYNGGKRGGRVKVRAKIEKADKNRLLIKDLPYGVTTSSLIDSIGKAVDKGKIKIKKIDDNTAEHVEIAIELANGVSPDVAVDALYAFTNCEVSISPNCCVIVDNKPLFTTVEELLKISTMNTKALLKWELEIKKRELEEKWFFASLEKIFIQNRVYREIEECESWEEVMETIYREMRKYVATPSDKKKGDKRLVLFRDLTDDDITRLTEIRIKRISKYNSFKADEKIANLLEELKQVKHDLAHLTEYTIDYFQILLDKFGKGKERKTEITSFETIKVTQVVANNAKLYVDRKEGFIGKGLKKSESEFVSDCSDIDDIIVFRKDGKFLVTRISDKAFVGKNIIHVAVWKKGDDRTTYNLIYWDAGKARAMAKRFNVTAITRDKEYDLTKGAPKSKALYFSANPNGEAELVTLTLSPTCPARIKVFDYGFADLEIKGRASGGNIVTRYPVKKVVLKEAGHSTIGAMKIWIDEVSGRLNTEERGKFLGDFDTGEGIIAFYNDGSYELHEYDLVRKYEVKDLLYIGKFDPDIVVSAVHFDGEKGWSMVKRFEIDVNKVDQRLSIISDHRLSKIYLVSLSPEPEVNYSYKNKKGKHDMVLNLAEFVGVKGWQAKGNKLGEFKILKITESEASKKAAAASSDVPDKLSAGDTVDFDVNGEQGSLFK